MKLADKLDELSKRLQTFAGEMLALSRDLADAAKMLRGEK